MEYGKCLERRFCLRFSKIVMTGFQIAELLLDRDPENGQRFPTMLALREAKLRDWVREMKRMPLSAHVACRCRCRWREEGLG